MTGRDWFSRLPWSIVVLASVLLATGCLGILRCEAFQAGGLRYFFQQMGWAALGVLGMVLLSFPSYRILLRWVYLIFAVSLAALVAVYFFPKVNNAHRWIRLGPVGFQPSEFAKLAFVLALSRYLMYRENYRRLRGLAVPFLFAVAPVLLILKEPDLGTAAVFLPVLFLMLFAAGARRVDLVRCVLIGAALLPLLWTQMSREQKSRVTALFGQAAAGQKPTDDDYQLYQGKQMLAMGGVWGSWIAGQPVDDPAVYSLPEARSDFIACVIGERFGLWGLGLMLLVFALLVWRIIVVAAGTSEPFGRLVAAGVAALLAVQVVVNVGMTVGLLPVTGLPLPMVSYGGSGVLANCLALGLVLNVALRPGYEVSRQPFRYALK